METDNLEALLAVQEHDTALDRLRHRLAALAEREAHRAAVGVLADLDTRLADARARRDEAARVARRGDDDANTIAEQARGVDRTLYGGTVSSPRELQALQADLESLRRRQRELEDVALELMEAQEVLDGEVAALADAREDAAAKALTAADALAAAEAVVQREIGQETDGRASAAAGIAPSALALYERCRERAGGIGVARLIGTTCQGCRLTIPTNEVDRIRHRADGDGPDFCDNCGAILVPA